MASFPAGQLRPVQNLLKLNKPSTPNPVWPVELSAALRDLPPVPGHELLMISAYGRFAKNALDPSG